MSEHSMEFMGGSWPTASQLLLLHAAFSERDSALAAWEQWKQRVDFGTIDNPSQKLLPLVYRRLTDLGLSDPLLGRLKGYYRLTWYKNQQLFHQAAPVLGSLAKAGIPSLALKGPALAVLYYHDLGLRTMMDFDMLVTPAHAAQTITLLQRHGWQAKPGLAAKLTPDYLSVSKGFGFENGQGQAIDLHWYAMVECCYAGADDDLWRDAVPMEAVGVRTLALRPTAQLLHVCLHGYKWDPIPATHWVADALAVMRAAGPQIDWDELVEMAQRRSLTLPLLMTLRYLKEVMAADIPAPTLSRLQALPVLPLVRREYKALTEPLTLGGLATMHWARHRRAQGEAGFARAALAFPDYIRRGLALDHLWQVPQIVLAETQRRLALRGARRAGGV